MSPDVIGYVLGAGFAFAAAIYTVRSTRKAKETQDAVDQVRADGEAYERAQRINQEMVHELQTEAARLRSALADLRVELAAEQVRSAQLTSKVEALQRSVNRLTALLREHEIPIPAWGD